MNAARITAAAAIGLVFALGAAQAQDAKTTPYQEQKAVEKSDTQKAPSAKADAALSTSATATDSTNVADTAPQTPAQKPARESLASTRSSGGGTSINSLAKLEDFDKNKDGSIAKDEAPANDQLALNFQSYDKDGDGKISKQEFQQYKNGNRQLASNKPAKAKQEPKPEQQ